LLQFKKLVFVKSDKTGIKTRLTEWLPESLIASIKIKPI